MQPLLEDVTPLSRQDPDRIGAFTLLGRLGAGAMGRVYLARSASGRLVAVKTIRPELTEEADFRARFTREVAAARRISGAFTAPVIDADPDAETPWLATSYVAAPSLERLIRTCGPLPAPAVRWLAAGCAEALESIHAAGLVHRDLKPSNVLISPEGPRVIDFGVVRATARATLTAAMHPVGTPAYMAPEQAREARQVTAAADVFSLGSTLLFAATGHPPYRGDSVTDVLVRLATEPPDLSDLPEELAELVGSCLQRDPGLRPTPADLLAMLGEEDFAPAPLPAPALAVIERYQRGGQGRTHEGEPDDRTFASMSSGGREAKPDTGAGSTTDEGTASGHRRTLRLPVVAVAACGLLAFGSLAGLVSGLLWERQHQAPPGPAPPPPGGPPRPPLSGAEDQLGGPPRIVVNQPFGDQNTVFVIHGTGWRPGASITVTLQGSRPARYRPSADRAGTFNFAIDQGHEFFPGAMPTGVYHVVVASEGRSATTTFRVDRGP